MIYRSSAPDVEIPDVTLVEHVLGRARERGEKVALVDAGSGERLTYGELAEGVEAVAAGLAGYGVAPGDVVALISHNQPRYPLALYGALAAGATITPVNPVLTVDEMAKQLTVAKASVVISSAQAATKAAAVAELLDIAHHFVIEDASNPSAEPISDGRAASFGELLSGGGVAPKLALDAATAIAVLPFSSGTTSLPKGVMLTHRNLVANLEQNGAGWKVIEDDVLAAPVPFFHIYGLSIVLNTALHAGATVVIMERYSLAAYLQSVQDHGVTRAFLAPPIVVELVTAPGVEGYDLSSLKYGICGAAPLDVEITERAEQRLGCLIRQGYGMTEASPGATQVPDSEFASLPAGSVGRLIPNTEARLVDPVTGKDVDAGESGELWVRGPQVMAGYLNNPSATAEAIVEGDWLRTGDILRIDESGVFWVVDRLKELIKYKGYQVAPAELEAVLLTHPDVLDAAVIGVPHAEGGEAPKAFIVTARPLGEDELMRWVAERVAPYKKIREVEFIEAIPKSPSGKILRRLLKK